MTGATVGDRTPHVCAALVAIGILVVILAGGKTLAIHFEAKRITAIAPTAFALKNQGLAFQRAAVRSPHVLVLYGSSELNQPMPENASRFFRTAPSGFQVSPVGKAGTTSLIILEKLAALGAEVRGKKIAISLSPNWFFVPTVNPQYYRGNFSLQAASFMIFGNRLDFRLKRDIAARILQFPRLAAETPLLRLAVERLASGTWLDRVAFWTVWPIGKLQNLMLDCQDHFESLLFLLEKAKSAPVCQQVELDWPKLITQAADQAAAFARNQKLPRPEDSQFGRSNDATFLARLGAAGEWTDLELLLQTLRELGAEPLLMSMPIPGAFYDRCGISFAAREIYYEKIRILAHRYNCALADFADHDGDADFLLVPRNHLSAKGWMIYDRVLDDFFHGRARRV